MRLCSGLANLLLRHFPFCRLPSLEEGAARLDQRAQPSQQKRVTPQELSQFASQEASSAATSEDINIARGDSSGQIAEPENQLEEWRQSGGRVQLTSNISKDAVEQLPGNGTSALESAAAEGGRGQSPAARTSLAAELVERADDEDKSPAAALIGGSELPGLAAWDQQQRLVQEAASSEGSGTEHADLEQEHETPRKWIPMLQLSAPDGPLWDAASLGEEPGLHRSMSASKRKLRPSEDSQVLTVMAVCNETNFNGIILTLCNEFKEEWLC